MKHGQRVYVIEKKPGYCKIGVSDDFERRKKSIEMTGGFNATNSYTTEALENAFEVERTVHRQLKAFRKVGEWFSLPFDKAVSEVAKTADSIGKPWEEATQQEMRRTDSTPESESDTASKVKTSLKAIIGDERIQEADKLLNILQLIPPDAKESLYSYIRGFHDGMYFQPNKTDAPR